MIEVTVKTLDSRNHPFTVEDDITVKDFKDLIAEKVEIPAETQRLIFCGRVLQDAKKLNEYDVNGNVIHLVQRAPPPAYSRPNTNNTTRPTRSGMNFREFTSPNQIYLGSMAEIIDGQQGIPQLPLSSNLSNSRLNVARKMLALATAIIDQLENQNQDNSSVVDQLLDDPIDTTPLLAAQVYVPSFVEQEAALTAALSLTNNFLNNVNDGASGTQNNNAPSQPEPAASSEPNTDSPNYDDEVATAFQPPQAETEAASAPATEQPQAEATEPNSENASNQTTNANIARPASLATLITELNRIQARLQPFMNRYLELMQTDPTFESDAETEAAQRVFDRVSAAMHALGHGYHALSDVICQFNRPTPRALLCRPTLVPQAVVQAGISLPVHVQAQVDVETVNSRNLFQRLNDMNSEEGSEQGNDTSGNMEQQPPQETNTETPPTTENSSTPTTETPNTTTNQQPPTGPQIGRPHVTVTQRAGGGRNVDIIVAMNPDDDSFQQALGPNQEFIQSLLSAVTNSVMRSVNFSNLAGGVPVSIGGSGSINIPVDPIRPGIWRPVPRTMPGNNVPRSSTPETETTTTENPSTNSATNGAGQNSQARGNTATLPTTSTQTPRATPRPHVQLSPHSFRAFDPFLQCNSHHITGRNRGNANRGAQNGREEASNEGELLSQLRRTNIALNRLARVRTAVDWLGQGVPTTATSSSTANPATASRPATATATPGSTSAEGTRVQGAQPATATNMDVDSFHDASEHVDSDEIASNILPDSAGAQNAEEQTERPDSTTGYNPNAGTRPTVQVQGRIDNLFTQPMPNTDLVQSLLQAVRVMRRDVVPRSRSSSRSRTGSGGNSRRNSQPRVLTSTPPPPPAPQTPSTLPRFRPPVNLESAREAYGETETEVNYLSKLHDSLAASLAQNRGGNKPETSKGSESSKRSTSETENILAPSSMDVDTFYDAPKYDDADQTGATEGRTNNRVVLPTNGESSSSPTLPEVNIGSEFWHSNVPSEWVSVVTRDIQAQRHDNTTTQQPPYSEAYLSSVPAKRRKLIPCNKPQGSLPQVITESLRQAVLTTGLSQVAPIDIVAGAAGGDSTIQAAYREELRQSVRARPPHATPPGIAPIKRFPNASFCFQNKP